MPPIVPSGPPPTNPNSAAQAQNNAQQATQQATAMQAALEKVNAEFGADGDKDPWWKALTTEQRKRAIQIFNQIYGNVARRPGGYSDPAAFLADPMVKRPDVQDTLTRLAAPFQTSYTDRVPLTGSPWEGGLGRSSLGGVVRTRSAEADIVQVTKAINTEGASYSHMKTIVAAAAKHGVPWQVLWGLLRKESGFNPRPPPSRNSNGSTDVGIAQINSVHKVPDKLALDPAFAIDWAAAYLKERSQRYGGDWSLAVLSYNRPRSADHIFHSKDGSSEPGWAAHDRNYVSGVFAGLDQFGFDPAVETKGLVGGTEGGGGGGQQLALPDPAATKQQMAAYLRSLFFREPTEAELNGAVQIVNGIVTENFNQTQAAGGGATNPYRTPGDDAEELHHPLPGATRTSKFGPRVHPVHGEQKMHSGTDWAAPEGTPIKAAVSGKVIFAGKKGGYGNLVEIEGQDGTVYRYAHLSRIGVTKDAQVMAGAGIGAVGNTGLTNKGPGGDRGHHLHFEIRKGGKAIDPETVFAADDNSPAPAPMGTGAITGPTTVTQGNPNARLEEHVKGMPEYKELYGRKPAGVSDEAYAASFAGVGTEMLGATTQANEAIRAGLATGQASTTAGVIAGDPKSHENKTFRQKMFMAAEEFNRML